MPEKSETVLGKQYATVMIAHKSNGESELPTLEGEEVELIVDPTISNVEGWVLVKNKEGRKGRVPVESIEQVSKPPPKSLAESRIVVAVYGTDLKLKLDLFTFLTPFRLQRD